jgi:hypothetical protein
MFDIWGKTVNLASRMQSTGLPGRIQVSDSFHRVINAIPGHSYHFEESHNTLCKGFGMVRTYFVQTTDEAPPRELMISLGLEPNLGPFYYENPLPAGAAAAPKGSSGSTGSGGHHTAPVPATSRKSAAPPSAAPAAVPSATHAHRYKAPTPEIFMQEADE